MSSELTSIIEQLRAFADERDWQQFHSPKNLSMAISVESAELLEHFQWLTEEQSKQLSPEAKQEVAYEMADIFLYLLRMSDQLDINLIDSARSKICINAEKYPVEKSRGRSDKYTAYIKDEDNHA